MSYAPYRPPHDGGCPICDPPPSGRELLLILLVVLGPAILLGIVTWLVS